MARKREYITHVGDDTSTPDHVGSDGLEKMWGMGGNDTLRAYGGDDYLWGGDGRDRLFGGLGADYLNGGEGRDRFYFSSLRETRGDRIDGFDKSDVMVFSGIDANTERSGNQAFRFIDRKAFSGTAGELQEHHVKGSTFVRGDVDGDGRHDFSVKIYGNFNLTRDDFVL